MGIENSKQPNTQTYVDAIRSGDRVLLSRAITLVESQLEKHQKQAEEILEKCMPFSGNSFRMAITGTPGVGKSSLIESFTKVLLSEGHKVAILAIDPSSQKTKGSILGDKTRMQELSMNENVYIRPSPAGNTLGGVAAKTREAIFLCEAAGFDFIIIETVGVGQSEITVHGMVDFFTLVLQPNAGDELQGIKRGIVEMADLILINKSEEPHRELARKSALYYKNALHYLPAKENNWQPEVLLCSALQSTGLQEIYQLTQQFKEQSLDFIQQNRFRQSSLWYQNQLQLALERWFIQTDGVEQFIQKQEQLLLEGKSTSAKSCRDTLEFFKSQIQNK